MENVNKEDVNKREQGAQPETDAANDPAVEYAKREEQDRPAEKKHRKDKSEKENEKLADELKKLHEKNDQLNDRLLRTAAEYDNYRKRTDKEKSQSVDYGMGKAITALLPVVDNLERASGAECADDEYKKGVELTVKTFLDALDSLGVQPIEALGKPFDPLIHSAVQQLEAGGAESGTVTAVYQKGYTLNGRVIRHAMVAVAP